MFKTLLLTCSERFRDERTDQAIYHILQGKKSIQTIQDTYLYNLEPYYRILPHVSNPFFRAVVEELVQDNLMEPSIQIEDSFTITNRGKEIVGNTTLPSILTYLHGRKYSAIGEAFEKRLLLFFQVISNKQMNNGIYVPVIDDFSIMNDIKQIVQQMAGGHHEIAQQLYQEITHIFVDLDDRYPSIFIDRLTGYNHYGKSMQQLAREQNVQEIELYILWKSIIHYMVDQCEKEPGTFPLLALFTRMNEDNSLTISAKQTKSLLASGLTIEQIADRRTLKINTVYDHIVEIALVDAAFPIDSFIDDQKLSTIIQRAYALNTYQLRALKLSLGDSYSYFQIRLALARGGSAQ